MVTNKQKRLNKTHVCAASSIMHFYNKPNCNVLIYLFISWPTLYGLNQINLPPSKEKKRSEKTTK